MPRPKTYDVEKASKEKKVMPDPKPAEPWGKKAEKSLKKEKENKE